MNKSPYLGRSLATIVVAASMFAIAGCDKNDTSKNGTPAGGTRTESKPTPPPPMPDNTAANKDHDTTKSPLDQGQSADDVRITADIRKAIMDDKAMSMNAQNCKVITNKGVVTLRGVVDSQMEKDSIEAKAKAALGVTRVDNQLEVKPK